MLSFAEGAKTRWWSLFEEAEPGWKAILDSAASQGSKQKHPSAPKNLRGFGEGRHTNTRTSPSHVTCRSINKDARIPFVLLRESITRQRQAPAGQVHPTLVSDGLAEALARRGGYGDRGTTPGEQQQAEKPLHVAMAPRFKQPLPLMQSRPNFHLAAVAEVIR